MLREGEKFGPRIARLGSGGREVFGNTPYGSFRVEWQPEAHGEQCSIVTADGRVVGTAYIEIREPPERKRVTTPCKHRGDEIERVECASCKGSVRVAVFGCALHGRCTIQQHVDGARQCVGCGDYEGVAEAGEQANAVQ